MSENNKIKFSLYLHGWSYEAGSRAQIREEARKVQPLEFLPEMKGHIFCPECCAPLFRSPEEKDYAANGRKAFFAHSRGFDINCSLRVKQGEGKKYINEEEASKAVADGELVVIQAFMQERPEPPLIDGPVVYEGEPIEDVNGPITSVPIGRHNGEEFRLPSRITTIRGMCREFDDKLNKHFLFPGEQAAKTLRQHLIRISDVREPCASSRIYYGRITRSSNFGPNPWNQRLTFIEFENDSEYKDFCLKTTDEISREQGINDESIGRIAIAYGPVRESGIGLCISNLGWGEFALLPQRYEYLLD